MNTGLVSGRDGSCDERVAVPVRGVHDEGNEPDEDVQRQGEQHGQERRTETSVILNAYSNMELNEVHYNELLVVKEEGEEDWWWSQPEFYCKSVIEKMRSPEIKMVAHNDVISSAAKYLLQQINYSFFFFFAKWINT